MSDKWIRFNKGLLIFSMITCLFSVIILTAFLADDKRLGSNAWIVFISGLLAVIFVHAVWGLFIEIANNLYMLNEGKIQVSEAKDSSNKIKISESSWVCERCGTSNNDVLNFCTKCGKSKT